MSAATEKVVDPPLTEVELVPEKETIEDVKEPAPGFPCQLADIELVYKIAQSFLPGLATACVDNTTGGIFRTPGSVAADLRTEMIEYLTQRSESFVAESVILEGADPQTDTPTHPFDIVSDFVDDFASTKRNFFSRVSGWLLSEKREDKIDDFVQDMELNGFWLVDKRSTVAETLLKNVDLKNRFHCDQKFNTEEERSEHVGNCPFRPLNCNNEGCDVTFSAKNKDDHDSICPFKIIPCEQNCSEHIMRRDMDRHCITVCKMKLVACPFYAVGCEANVPNSMMDQHRNDEVQSHVLSTLISIHKEASVEDLKPRAAQVLEMSSGLAEARDVRSLTRRIKNIEAKLGPLEIKPRQKDEADSPTKNAEKAAETENKATEEAANKVSQETTKAVENVQKESNETANKVAEESSEAAKAVEKESTVQKESNEKVTEESSEVAKPVEKESTVQTESNETGNKVTEESSEAAKPVEKESTVQKESNETGNTVTEESYEAAKPVEKESNEPATNKISEEESTKAFEKESNEPAANANKVSEEESTEAPEPAMNKVSEEPTEAATNPVSEEESDQATNDLKKEVAEAELEEPAEVSTKKESTESTDEQGEVAEKNVAAESSEAAAEINENLDKELTKATPEMAVEQPAEEPSKLVDEDADKESAKIKSEDPAPTS
ncbi:hypothetical protein LINGRAHAP2_LOCUS12902 [Linum grandiflorum]